MNMEVFLRWLCECTVHVYLNYSKEILLSCTDDQHSENKAYCNIWHTSFPFWYRHAKPLSKDLEQRLASLATVYFCIGWWILVLGSRVFFILSSTDFTSNPKHNNYIVFRRFVSATLCSERFDVKAEKHHVIQGPVDIIPLNWRFYDQDFSLKIQMGHTS